MRILHVVPTYFPAVRYGGPIYSVHALCRGLVEQDHRVEVFTTDADGPGRSDVPLGRPVDLDGVGVNYFPCVAPRRLYRSPGLARALSERVTEFDLVHLHSVFLLPTLAAARAAEARGVPWVVSPRGMLVEDLIRRHGRLRKGAWIRLFERRTLAGAAFVHATSELERQDLAPFVAPGTPIEVVPNGVELPRGPGHVPAQVRELLAPGAGSNVLYLGRLSWKKGLGPLVDAVAAHPTARRRIAGPDDEGIGEGLLRRAGERGAAGRVRLLGPVAGDTKRALLEGADCLALPSLSENFGNVVLEALAHGTPVVAGRGVGAAALVRRADAGLVTEVTPKLLAATLSSMLALGPGELSEMGARGRRLVAEGYGHGSVATRFATLYEEHHVRAALPANTESQHHDPSPR